MYKVWHAVYLDNLHHWCEACGNSPKGVKVYIDDYKGFNPAYWCEDCVKEGQFKIVGWLENEEEYLELERKFYRERRRLNNELSIL